MSRRQERTTQPSRQGYLNSSAASQSRHTSKSSMRDSSIYSHDTPATSISAYAPSNVTGFRKTLAVPGLPGSTFFTEREARVVPVPPHADRRSEIDPGDHRDRARGRTIHRSMTADYPTGTGKTIVVRRDSATGRELVRYNTAPDAGQADLEWDERGTVVPEDSVSQCSSNRNGNRRARARAAPAPASVEGQYRCAPVLEGMRTYDSHRGVYVVERRPQGC